MLRSNRGVFLALGLILAGHHPDAVAQPKQASAEERSARALENIAARYDQQAKGAEGAPETKPCEQGDDHRDSDLCAQWKAADAAAESAWWAKVSGFASAASTLLVLFALYLAFRSNWIARDTAKRQLRAYVSHKLENVEFDPESRRITYPHGFVNTGQTPALDFQMYIKVYVGPKDAPESFFEEHHQGFEPRSRMPLGAGMDTVFPRGFQFTPEELKDVLANERVCYMFGRATYRDVFDRPHFVNVRRCLLFTTDKKSFHFFVMKEGNECS